MKTDVLVTHEKVIPDLLAPFSFPLQSVNILSGTHGKTAVPVLHNAPEKRPGGPVKAKTTKNDGMAPKTKPCYAMIYPEFYAGPHAVSVETAYGFNRDMPMDPFHFSSHNAVHRYEDPHYMTHHAAHHSMPKAHHHSMKHEMPHKMPKKHSMKKMPMTHHHKMKKHHEMEMSYM